MNPEPIQCVDPALYSSQLPGSGFEEGRAILLGKYSEKELDAKLENKIREHLDRCNCCTQFLSDFENIDQTIFGEMVVDASCPSSLSVDRFLFDRDQLSQTEADRIDQHVAECEFCKEEVAWLKNLQGQKVIEFVPQNRDWTKILSIAAAIFFVLVSAILYQQKISTRTTEQRLQSLAQVKEPDQINFDALRVSSVALPQDMDRLYEEGVNSIKQHRFQDAAKALEQVASARPDHSGAIYLLGYSYYQLRELEKAFALCDRAEQIRPHNMERCLSLVHIALKTGHYGRAIREICGLYHEAPDQPQVKELYEQITSITRGQTIKL
jgi:tetratricopeptide (TPR) repeat protein